MTAHPSPSSAPDREDGLEPDPAPPRVLITNDDGIGSQGLHVLAEAAVAAGLDVTVAAPRGQRSGAGTAMSALEAGGRLLVEERKLDGLDQVRAVAVEASPAMIVLVAAYGAFGPRPALVLSGINHGPNAGRAVLHSGTVGAAFTAESSGIPALAISVASEMPAHWDTAAQVTAQALEWFLARADRPAVANVNIPDVPPAQLKGFRSAHLADYGAVQVAVGEPGRGFIPVTFTRARPGLGDDTDIALLRQGWATVTVLHSPRESREPGYEVPAS